MFLVTVNLFCFIQNAAKILISPTNLRQIHKQLSVWMPLRKCADELIFLNRFKSSCFQVGNFPMVKYKSSHPNKRKPIEAILQTALTLLFRKRNYCNYISSTKSKHEKKHFVRGEVKI